jgi:hypothetical protein
MPGMLPASFQVPAAIILVVGGVLACFAGYRLFRVVLGIYGFILGALVASSMVGTSDTASMLVAAGVGGIIGALLLILAYFVGVALIGAGIGALLANVIWAQLGREPHALIVVAFSIAGALGALALQRYVIVLGTAFGGAWTLLVGGLALTGNRVAGEAAQRGEVWLAYPMNPAQGERWVIITWIVLGVIGTAVQLGVTGKDTKR